MVEWRLTDKVYSVGIFLIRKGKIIMNANMTSPTFTSLDSAISALFGEDIKITGRSGISGGDINEAYRLTLSDGNTLFMKTNRLENASFFTAEAAGLAALASTHAIGLPKILGTGIDTDGGFSFLLLEMIRGAARVRDYWEILGQELASLHKYDPSEYSGTGKYGFHSDNYIGMSAQKNTPCDSWVEFFRSNRLEPQFKRAGGYFSPEDLKRIHSLLDGLDRLLIEPEYPSLLHGDLWGGNVMTGNDGKAWLIDPAVYVGHREVDIAMTELFGGFSQSFYASYQESAPLEPGYQDRLELYNLYQLLNHLNMFGGSYLSSVLSTVRAFT